MTTKIANMNVHFSSKTDDWATPQDLFDKLNNHFNFTLDVCASVDNAKCGEYFTVDDDGLKQDWTGVCWMNPPACTCDVHPKPLYLHHENEKMSEMFRDIATHQRQLVVENGKWEKVRIFMVQGMQQEVGARSTGKTQEKPRKQAAFVGRETEVQHEQQGEGSEENQEPSGQSQAQTEEIECPVFMERDTLGWLPQKMGKQVRVLWSGDEISTGSFHPVIASELSRNNTKQYGPIMLYMQLEKGGDSPRRLAGFGAICPDCGKAGIAITKPITAFMNPPYGREIIHWMKKAYESSLEGATVVCLVPARTDTKWWHDYAAKGDVLFLRGRLKFGNAKNSAPFPSAIVVFGRDWKSIFKESKDGA